MASLRGFYLIRLPEYRDGQMSWGRSSTSRWTQLMQELGKRGLHQSVILTSLMRLGSQTCMGLFPRLAQV